MQLLGLSESTPRSESRWRALFWPTIRNEVDYDYVTRQGFWICFVVAAATLIWGTIAGHWVAALFEAVFFFLAGLGVRERSRTAALAAFAAYLLSALVLQRYSHNGFGVLRIIFLALLFANVRGNWLSARWVKESIQPALPSLNHTIGDKLANRLPEILWPKARFLFYVLAAAEIGLLLIALFATTAPPELSAE